MLTKVAAPLIAKKKKKTELAKKISTFSYFIKKKIGSFGQISKRLIKKKHAQLFFLSLREMLKQ